jgi:hypothetical protein
VPVDATKLIRISNELRDHVMGIQSISRPNAVRIPAELREDGWWYFTVTPAPRRHIRPMHSRRGS